MQFIKRKVIHWNSLFLFVHSKSLATRQTTETIRAASNFHALETIKACIRERRESISRRKHERVRKTDHFDRRQV